MHFEVGEFIPLFGGYLTLNVSSDVVGARQKHSEFGEYANGIAGALCSFHSGDCALFFHEEALNHGTIAHEILHATCRILDFSGVTFDLEHQECHAALCGWITDWVYAQLGKHMIKVF